MPEIIRPSNGERLLVDRLRRGETQREAALRLGLGGSRKIYQLMETDCRDSVQCRKIASRIKVGKLLDHERCRLKRRRSGKTQAEIADLIGVSRYWLNQMEIGSVGCEKLLEFWSL